MVEIISLKNGVEFLHQQVRLRIEAWGLNSFRVRATMLREIDESLDWALLTPNESKIKVSIEEKMTSIENGEITCKICFNPDNISSIPWNISYHDTRTGKELTSENHHRFKRWRGIYLKPREGDTFQVEARFKQYEDERIYGLGQHQHGRLDNKGCVIELLQRNTEVCIPFMYSTRGYGFLWNNPAIGNALFARNKTEWTAEVTSQIDYWITAGDNPAEIQEQYTAISGRTPMMPEYGLGFTQCKLRYKNQQELLAVAREHKKRGLPMDIIVADFFQNFYYACSQ